MLQSLAYNYIRKIGMIFLFLACLSQDHQIRQAACRVLIDGHPSVGTTFN